MALDIFGRDTDEAGYVDNAANTVPEYFPLQASREVQTSVASDILGFTGAVIGDFGTSVYNSIVPEDNEVSTADFLGKVSPDALRMYEENEDTVHAASFIAGVFAPAGIALKGMKVARDGVKGYSWFSTAGKADQMAKANSILKNSGIASADYKSALTKIYARDIANVVVDNAAAELAIVSTLNAHPFMEDYVKDPVSSFTTGLLLGTVITGPLSHFATRGDVRRAAQEVYEPAMKFVGGLSQPVKITEDLSTQLAGHQVNIDNYKAVLADVESKTLQLDAITVDFVKGFLKTEQDRQLTAFTNMTKGEMSSDSLPKEFRDFIIQEISGRSAKFGGINTIRFASAAEDMEFLQQKAGKLLPSTTIGTEVPLTTRAKKGLHVGELRATELVYSQRFDAFLMKGDHKNFGVAADITTDAENLTKGMTSNWYRVPNYTAWEESLVSTTSKVDLEYLRKLKAVDEMPDQELRNIAVSPDDGPMLNAVISRIEKLGTTDPKLASELRVNLTKTAPNWDSIQKQMESSLPVIGRNPTASGLGVKVTYLEDLGRLDNKWDSYDLRRHTTGTSKKLIDGWMGSSGMTTLRHAVDDAFRPSEYAMHGAPAAHIRAVKEIYSSPASKSLRQELMQLADAEGNVYLYRGLRGEGFGSNAIESFTTNAEKASDFGAPKLYKVKVQDILGGIRDKYGKTRYEKSTEILVMSTTRDAVKDLPILERAAQMPEQYLQPETFGITLTGMKSWDKQNLKNLTLNLFEDFHSSNPLASFKGTEVEYKTQLESFLRSGVQEYVDEVNKFNSLKTANTTKTSTEVGYSDLLEAFKRHQIEGVDTMLKQGLAPESIELRLGMPKGTVNAYIAGGDLTQVNTQAYKSADIIGTQLTNQNRSIIVGTTQNRVPVAEMRAAQHAKHLDDSDKTIKSLMLDANPSVIGDKIKAFLDNPDNIFRQRILSQELHHVNPATYSSRAIFSADFSMRDMGTAGEIIAAIGKDTMHLKDAVIKQLLPSVSASYGRVLASKADTVEYMTAYNVNAGIKGYREYRNGSFWMQDADNPWTKLPNGSKQRNMIEVEYNGKPFSISSQAVRDAFEEQQKLGRELYKTNSIIRQTMGMPPLSDIGYWNPSLRLDDKHVTYVFDRNTQTTRVIWGYTADELALNEKAFVNTLSDTQKKYTELVKKGIDQEQWNRLNTRHDNMFMSEADTGMQHSGASQQAILNMNTNLFSDLATSYEKSIHKQVESLMELQYSDVFQKLKNLDVEARRIAETNKGNKIQQALSKSPNAGSTAYNTMLGRSDLKDYVAWTEAQNGIQIAAEMTLQHLRKAMDPILNPAKGIFGKGKSLSDKDYENLVTELEMRGVDNPFAAMDEALAKEVFHTQSVSQAPNMTPKLVALSNGLASTVLLRVMELGQPIVNMLSLPVLTSAAIQRQFRQEYMGAQLSPTFHLNVTKAMYDGMRFLNHPEYERYAIKGKELGIMEPTVSEVTKTLALTRSFQPGAMQGLENALQHKLVDWLSWGADKSESLVREVAFSTGVSLAKKAYPNLGDSGVMTFARNFVDTAIGNYSPAQRPAMFQGTMGTAMGLFQTYMVTMAQQIYRKAELRDWKGLTKIMLTQSTIFGVKGLPGFNAVSEQIGNKLSDQNYDLTTGMYRALDELVADLVLYGLPSNLGPAVYTRGDIQPRLPNIAGGLQNLAAVNILGSATDAAMRLTRATKEIGDEGAAHAFMEALSMQSISRPIARMSELVTGHAVTRDGNEVAGPEEIYSAQGIMARIFATRSLSESKAREARHLKNLYGGLDREQRSEAKGILAAHVRSNTLTPDIVERVQEKYMRTGSPQGWRAAVDAVMRDTDAPGVSATRNYLGPDHPAGLLIDDMDN